MTDQFEMETPIPKDKIEPGVHVETYALAGNDLDLSEEREPGSGWIADWTEDKETVVIEYGTYLDSMSVKRKHVRIGNEDYNQESATRGLTPTFP